MGNMFCCCNNESAWPNQSILEEEKMYTPLSNKEGIETMIGKWEQKMTISKVSTGLFLEKLDLVSEKAVISHQELVHLLSERSLAYDRVFSLIKTGNVYEKRTIKLIAIILGGSKIIKKFEWLFKEFDTHEKHYLDECELRTLLESLYQLSVEICPYIAIGETTNELTKEEIDNYLNIFKHKKEILIQNISRDVLRDGRIEYKRFIDLFSNIKGKYVQVSCTNGFRNLLKITNKSN